MPNQVTAKYHIGSYRAGNTIPAFRFKVTRVYSEPKEISADLMKETVEVINETQVPTEIRLFLEDSLGRVAHEYAPEMTITGYVYVPALKKLLEQGMYNLVLNYILEDGESITYFKGTIEITEGLC